MTEPLSPARLTEIRSTLLGDWYGEPWHVEHDDPNDEDCYLLKAADGTVFAVFEDFAHGIAVFTADAHEAVPELLAEVDRLKAALTAAEELAAEYGARIVAASMAAAPLNIKRADR